MEYRRLGDSGLWLSEIALGTYPFGGPDAVDTVATCVRAAFDAGVTTFQAVAADAGGAAEEALGAAVADLPRDDVVLTGGVAWPVRVGPGGANRKRVAAAVHGTLRRLRTDHLDVLVLPRHDPHTPLEETFAALGDLVRRGALHYLALLEWSAEQLAAAAPVAAAAGVPLVADQVHYSMLWRVPEAQVLPAADRAGIGALAYAPLAQGMLTGKYAGGARPAGSRAARGAGTVRHLLHPEVLDRVDMVAGVAAAAGLTPAQLAVAWVLQHRSVSAALVGASTPQQVVELCAAAGRPLDLDALTGVDALLGTTVQTDPRLGVPTVLPG